MLADQKYRLAGSVAPPWDLFEISRLDECTTSRACIHFSFSLASLYMWSIVQTLARSAGLVAVYEAVVSGLPEAMREGEMTTREQRAHIGADIENEILLFTMSTLVRAQQTSLLHAPAPLSVLLLLLS